VFFTTLQENPQKSFFRVLFDQTTYEMSLILFAIMIFVRFHENR